jgi:glycosyltransferase involved in cell wall biosynthesis
MPRAVILLENSSFPADPRVAAQVDTLARHGWDTVVICPEGSGPNSASSESVGGVDVHRFPLRPSDGSSAGYVREYATAFWRVARCVRMLSRVGKFDVVHACNPPDVLLLAAVRERPSAGFIFDHHDLSPELYEARSGRRDLAHRSLLLAERTGFALADVVLATNESFRRVAIDRGKKRPEDVFVVRNGPDASVFRPVPGDPAIRAGVPYVIGYVGVMGLQDGIIEALHALAALSRSRTDWRAIFVGDGDALPRGRVAAQELAIADRVVFTGFVRDRQRVVQLLSSFDVCLSPEPRNSLNDNSTLIKIAEYMAAERPIVAYDLKETRATAGEAALYARGDAPRALADAVSELLDDPARRARMGAVGRARVLERLSWQHSEAPLLAAYDRARDAGRSRRRRSARRRPTRIRD